MHEVLHEAPAVAQQESAPAAPAPAPAPTMASAATTSTGAEGGNHLQGAQRKEAFGGAIASSTGLDVGVVVGDSSSADTSAAVLKTAAAAGTAPADEAAEPPSPAAPPGAAPRVDVHNAAANPAIINNFKIQKGEMEMIKKRREKNPHGATSSLPEHGITKQEMEFILRERQINAKWGYIGGGT